MNRTVVLQPAKRTPLKTSRTKSSNTQRTENKTTDVVINQHSHNLLMMVILMSETCWAHKKWNEIARDIKLVFHSSVITMMHGPINIRNVIIIYFPWQQWLRERSSVLRLVYINCMCCFLFESVSTKTHYHWILPTHVFPLCRFWMNTVTTSAYYTTSSNFERELFCISGFTNTFQFYVYLVQVNTTSFKKPVSFFSF